MAYVDELGPMVVPVTFVLDGEDRCCSGSRRTPSSRGTCPTARAAFEVDDIDYFTRSGWSVVLRGHASRRSRATSFRRRRIGPHRGRRASAACTSG